MQESPESTFSHRHTESTATHRVITSERNPYTSWPIPTYLVNEEIHIEMPISLRSEGFRCNILPQLLRHPPEGQDTKTHSSKANGACIYETQTIANKEYLRACKDLWWLSPQGSVLRSKQKQPSSRPTLKEAYLHILKAGAWGQASNWTHI